MNEQNEAAEAVERFRLARARQGRGMPRCPRCGSVVPDNEGLPFVGEPTLFVVLCDKCDKDRNS